MALTWKKTLSWTVVQPCQRFTLSLSSAVNIHRVTERVTTTSRIVLRSSSRSSSLQSDLSEDDQRFLFQALEYARIGLGHTFPNPAVGCVLVQQDTKKVLGAGLHPRTGFPHAEIFALLEAANHVDSGVEAAKTIIEHAESDGVIQALAERYAAPEHNGPQELFKGIFETIPVTAYVTLEPCCHYGKTPPCASALVLAGVDRVVVGLRDPNPRVDGGGLKALQDSGIDVDVAKADEQLGQNCADIVQDFVKRIVPKNYDTKNYSHINGTMRRELRSIAGRKKTDDTLSQVQWTEKTKPIDEGTVDDLELPAEWMERVDGILWKEELVNLRLNKAVNKKKIARLLGERAAAMLGAHVVQSVGHTVLLYRPGIPPILNLEELSARRHDQNEDQKLE